MRRGVIGVALGLAFAERAALAEAPGEPAVTVHTELEARAHFGVATAPFDAPLLNEAKGQAFVFAASARHALSETLSLELHVPWVLGSVAQPAGSYVDAAAAGNPQLGAQYRLFVVQSSERERLLWVTAMLEVGAPFASHAPDLMPNRLLAIADGIEGRANPEWFTAGVLPITPSSGIYWVSARWSVIGELRLPLLPRVSQAALPSESPTNSLGFAAIVRAEARYRLSRRLSLASAAHLFFDIAPLTSHAGEISRVQDFERLSLHLHFGSSAALIVDLQTAIFGELGGSTVAGGLRTTASF